MKILVLGAGRMGYGAAYDLIHNSPDVTAVTIADFKGDAAEDAAAKIGTDRITIALPDSGESPAAGLAERLLGRLWRGK